MTICLYQISFASTLFYLYNNDLLTTQYFTAIYNLQLSELQFSTCIVEITNKFEIVAEKRSDLYFTFSVNSISKTR